jgi:hypothetical protein
MKIYKHTLYIMIDSPLGSCLFLLYLISWGIDECVLFSTDKKQICQFYIGGLVLILLDSMVVYTSSHYGNSLLFGIRLSCNIFHSIRGR